MIATGGTTPVEVAEIHIIENLRVGDDARIRKVKSVVKIWRDGIDFNTRQLSINATGWIYHMFDGYHLGYDQNPMKVSSNIQCDVSQGGNIEQHDKIRNPATNASTTPFTVKFGVRGANIH